jgi:hypothetical protein
MAGRLIAPECECGVDVGRCVAESHHLSCARQKERQEELGQV